MGLVKTYGQLLALRLLLGLFECGLFPGMFHFHHCPMRTRSTNRLSLSPFAGISFFLSGWYKRKEASKRISLFFAGAVMAGAFGGILGYGLSRMNGVGGKSGWSWIFIIEGLLTLVAGLASPWLVQDWPDQETKFLTPLEKQMVLERLKADTGLASQGTFNMRVVKRAALDWKSWLFMFSYIGVAMPIYSQSIFTPTIIASLGKWTTPQSLLLSTPPYVFAFITTMVTAYFSDKTGKRAVFLIFWSFMAVVGYILLITIPLSRPGGLYFAVFLTIGSIAPCIATTIVFAAGNFGNHYKKAVSMGMVFSLGNAGGIVASQ
jgi:MFS family permease